jgi:hypothetical protein
MSCTHCAPCIIVRANDGRWLARLEGVEFGPYKDRTTVVMFAAAKALQLRRLGRGVHLAVEDQDGITRAQIFLCKECQCSLPISEGLPG